MHVRTTLEQRVPLGANAGAVSAAAAWSPRGFADYRQFYPATPEIACRPGADATAAFTTAWDALPATPAPGSAPAPRIDARIALVFVRGLFGRWIPGHFAAPLRALRDAGYAAFVARSRAAGTIDGNAALLATDVLRRAPGAARLVFLCHSKGGLDLLEALRRTPELRRRAAAVVLCQTPRSGCAVLESVLLREHRDSLRAYAERAGESLARAALVGAGARPGCVELTGGSLAARIGALDDVAASLPTFAVASWSVQPSAWLDSQHGRLGAIRPRCAHDGLFFLEDLVWPAAAGQVLLPHIDHSQPCVGGLGFPHDRLWRVLTTLALAHPEVAG